MAGSSKRYDGYPEDMPKDKPKDKKTPKPPKVPKTRVSELAVFRESNSESWSTQGGFGGGGGMNWGKVAR